MTSIQSLRMPLALLPVVLGIEGEGRAALNQLGVKADSANDLRSDQELLWPQEPDQPVQLAAGEVAAQASATIQQAEYRLTFSTGGGQTAALLAFCSKEQAAVLVAGDQLWITNSTLDRLTSLLVTELTEHHRARTDWTLALWQADTLIACVRSDNNEISWSADREPQRGLLASAQTAAELVTPIVNNPS